mmetsp:Transcript_23230/g.71445  ORF Transcript_23230/g.71445 Transcript_23230/m.71445 type:complete len:661 (-) Transcript_23230:45-2027(-)
MAYDDISACGRMSPAHTRASIVVFTHRHPGADVLDIVSGNGHFWKIVAEHKRDISAGRDHEKLILQVLSSLAPGGEIEWVEAQDGVRCLHVILTTGDACEEPACERAVKKTKVLDGGDMLRRRPLPFLLVEVQSWEPQSVSSTTTYAAEIVADFAYAGVCSTIPMWVRFPQVGLEYVTDAFWMRLGYDRERHQALPPHRSCACSDHILGEALDAAGSSFRDLETTRDARPYDQHVTYKALCGAHVCLRCNAEPVLWTKAGKVLAVVGTHTEVFAEKDHAAEVSFIGKVSHEIRTPLSAISSSLELLDDFMATAPKDVADLWTMLHNATKQVRTVVDDVLDFTAVSSGRLQLNKEAFVLGDMLSEVAHMHRGAAQQKEISLELTLPSDFPHVVADRVRLAQVVTNLLSNAIKFTPQNGHVRVVLRMLVQSTTAQTIHFAIDVADTGRGIPKASWETIFDDFQQVRVADSGVGTGLGLGISSLLVGLHGGRLFVHDSTIEKGTTMRIELETPYPESPVPTATSTGLASASVTAAALCSTIGRCLLVDDMQTNRTVLAALIKKINKNIEICFAENGQQAVSLCQEHDYDVILMDVHMPVMDGIEAAKIITRTTRNKIVIGVTANTDTSLEKVCREAGMIETLLKPTTAKTLAASLARVLAPSS